MKKILFISIILTLLTSCINQETNFDKYTECCGEMWLVKTETWGWKMYYPYIQSYQIKSVSTEQIEAEKIRQIDIANNELLLINRCKKDKK